MALSNIIRTVKTHGVVITGTRIWGDEVILTDELETHLGKWDLGKKTLTVHYHGTFKVDGMTPKAIAWMAYRHYHNMKGE